MASVTRVACCAARPETPKGPPKMNPIETVQVQINQILGELVHAGSSMSSTIAYGMGMF
ncbi:hypothetical protein GCM10022417_07860 [Corynebacterium pilbarense]